VVGTFVPHPFCKEKQTMKNITILAIIGLIIYGFFSFKESKTKSYQKNKKKKLQNHSLLRMMIQVRLLKPLNSEKIIYG